jgi:1,4-alpha-glucan branching enzyme
MQDKLKSSKVVNKEETNIEDDVKKSLNHDKKTTTRKNTKKKITSKEIEKLEVNENVPKINEKDIMVDDTGNKIESKVKEAAKTTKSRRSVAAKTAPHPETNQDDNSKALANEIKTSATKKTSSKQTSRTTSKTIKATTDKTTKATQKTSQKTSIDTKSKAEQAKTTVKKVDKSDITNFNTYLFHQGKNYEAYDILGSHIKTEKRKKGVQFATWAPNAKEVYVVGDFSNFEVKDEYKLEKITENGIWKAFVKDAKVGERYKYCIIGKDDELGEYKADPYAIQTELRPDSASIIYEPENFVWNDHSWINQRNKINVLEQPLNVYEMHLGSWKRNKDDGFLTYEEISEELPKYLNEMGYTHVEIMPLVEHPLDASWGYQGTGYYSPTSRYGKLEGLKKLIDKLHQANIGVIMDWVPGHFCKDAHGLYKFDGTPTYEYQDEWRAENKGWGTCNFDLGRPEVKSYLISNALYWYREFHIDGLRVDAVSSILYLDYSRSHGEWVPNKYGGNGNLEAIEFLKELNKAVFAEYPTALMIAEESTAWPDVTKPSVYGGLGFNFKWNMGWMNDTLQYVEIDPKYRKHNHKNITFAMMYNYAENYLLPLSHDEVVHGKKSLMDKMWGDEWNKFAGLRAFMGYMMGHPGKKLTFMGCEFAQTIEWREYSALEWDLIDELEIHKKTQLFFKDLNNLYINNKAFWELDHDYRGFNWIEADNNEQSILIFTRRSRNDQDTLVFVINFTSKVYYDYQIGVPFLGNYKEIFNTDNKKYGGSGQVMDQELIAEKISFHNQPFSLKIKVPPMATLILKINEINMGQDTALTEQLDNEGANEVKENN